MRRPSCLFSAAATEDYGDGMADRVVSVSRVIKAPSEVIFDLLADPTRHADFDGSGTVQEVRGDTQRLALGSKFGMDMKMGPMPYRISSTVKEFEENRLIAWAHLGRHRWRYELADRGRRPTSDDRHRELRLVIFARLEVDRDRWLPEAASREHGSHARTPGLPGRGLTPRRNHAADDVCEEGAT